MPTRLRGSSKTYEIVSARDSGGKIVVRLADAALESFLRSLMADTVNKTALRAFVSARGHNNTRRLTDHELLRGVIRTLAAGTFNIVEVVQAARTPVPLQPKPVGFFDEPDPEPVIPPVTVSIRAEDGKAPYPTTVAINQRIKLKAVPSRGTGTYQWSTTSTFLTLEHANAQTVTVKGLDKPSAGGETITLTFTPAGDPVLTPTASVTVGTVFFEKEGTHDWGYDKYEIIPTLDGSDNATNPQPGPAIDYVSIQTGKVGKVKVTIQGLKLTEVFFTSSDPSVCKPKVVQPDANPFVLEINAKSKNKKQTEIRAHVGSKTGPVVAKFGVVTLKLAKYKAEVFRVVDTTSVPSSALSLAFKGSDLVADINNYYKQGVAEWDINGGTADIDVPYDLVSNGKLDMEPGKTTDEQKKIIRKCVSTRTRVVYVSDLRWCYYLARDAAAADNKIRLKHYDPTYIGYIGENKSYTIEDTAGNTTNVTVAAGGVNTATGVITLTAPIGTAFLKSDKASLIWPLGGLSGNPLWVKDKASLADLENYIAHELGHTVATLLDIGEVDNLMQGGSNTGNNLRYRPLAKFYKTAEKEQQWLKMSRP